jgi:CheY-like chemotaxis protein
MTTNLLLADDSATIQKVVGLTFAAEKVGIESVADGNQALEKIRSRRPDIVLADISLPGCNGYQLCETIKADPALRLIPVVLLVGAFESFDEQEATRVECDAYLTKPFDTSELIAIVRHLVKQHRAARAAEETAAPVKEAKVLVASVERGENPACGNLVSARTRESFLGANCILDIFDGKEFIHLTPAREKPAETPLEEKSAAQPPAPIPSPVIPFPGIMTHSAPADSPSLLAGDEFIDRIVEKVVHRMSEKVVREIAWEVVPEVAEVMVGAYLSELRNKNNE